MSFGRKERGGRDGDFSKQGWFILEGKSVIGRSFSGLTSLRKYRNIINRSRKRGHDLMTSLAAGDGTHRKKQKINDIRISRYVQKSFIKLGDTVEVSYRDQIDEANEHTIHEAMSASKVTIIDGQALMFE